MCLTNEHVGPKILAKIKICVLTRAELLIHLCYEIPCMTNIPRKTYAFSIMVAHQSTKKELVYANELYISTAFVQYVVCSIQQNFVSVSTHFISL